MKLSRTHLLSSGFIVLSFVMTAVLYNRLPEWVPTHWNARGDANGFMPKPWGPFLLPLTMAFTYGLLVVLPRISPQGYRMDRFKAVFELMQASILAFLFLLTVLALLAGIGVAVPMNRAVSAGVGLLLIVLGNFLGKVTKNFFVGIRTPWTLASDEVWLRTHRLGGKLFVLGGTVIFVSALLSASLVPLVLVVTVTIAILVVYSYAVYRRIE